MRLNLNNSSEDRGIAAKLERAPVRLRAKVLAKFGLAGASGPSVRPPDGQTDGRTDRRTERPISFSNIEFIQKTKFNWPSSTFYICP